MSAIVPVLVIALVLCWLAVRLYNNWLSRPRLNALGTIIGYRRINDDPEVNSAKREQVCAFAEDDKKNNGEEQSEGYIGANDDRAA